MRIDGSGIGGRDQELARLRLAIPGFGAIDGHGPGHDVDALGGGHHGNRAALGLQAGAAPARELRYNVAPGAGGVNDNPCAECLPGGGHRPAAGFIQCRHRRVADERAAALLEQLQVGLVQQIDIDVGGSGIENDTTGITVFQQRKPRLAFGDADFGHALLSRHHRIERRLLAIGHEEDRFARG